MALMKPKELDNNNILTAPKKAANKDIYPKYQTQPYNPQAASDAGQHAGNRLPSGLLGKQPQPITNQSATSETAQAPKAVTPQARMPQQPTGGQSTTMLPGDIPKTDFTPADLDTGDYSGVKSDKVLQYDPNDKSLVANQITGLLDPESAIMKKAKSQAAEYAAKRGLQSSSIGGEMALSAMIDKAMPIAQQDAQTFNQAQSQQWQDQAKIEADNLAREHSAAMADKQGTIQNQLQNNQLGWQGAEKATDRQFQAKIQNLQYQQSLGTLDKQQELQLQQMERSNELQLGRDKILQGYQVELNQLQNDQRWKELTAQLGSQMEQQSRGFDQQTKLEYGNAQSSAINTALQSVGMAMQNPNMTPEQQEAAVASIMGTLQSQANQLAVIYGSGAGTGGQQPGDSTGISNPNPPLITPPVQVTPPVITTPGSGNQPVEGDTNNQGQTYYGGGKYAQAGWYPKQP